MRVSGKASKVDLRGWASIYIYIHSVYCRRKFRSETSDNMDS